MPIKIDITKPLDLKLIAKYLEALEEKIVFKLLDRAQYKLNSSIYIPGKSGFKKYPNLCLLDIRLKMQEELEARYGRYFAPEEKPFCDNLPKSEREFKYVENEIFHIQNPNEINLTVKIKKAYLDFIQNVCVEGDDGHYGSSVEHDVYALQAIAERVHFGAFYVAEAKYQQDPKMYQKLIDNQDKDALYKKLTRLDVEEKICERVRSKAKSYQKEIDVDSRFYINPEKFVKLYKDVIIPLTKRGEIMYFLRRSFV